MGSLLLHVALLTSCR